ncbi:Uncharacterised protein [uncultured archaeon]|nr:Uncharacterised protein [uncultured archaeon]
MDYVIHINNGSETVKPIVLRLLPGEETIFNLKVVNHGEPSNISLEASDPVFEAVRLNKPDCYVVMEETVPIMARMPANMARLDGEILLSSSAGESRVPISLLREPEDPGDDLDDPGMLGDPDLKDDLESDESDLAEEWNEDESEEKDEEGEEAEDEGEVRRIKFSRDRDLQRYRAAHRPLTTAGSLGDKIELSTEAPASLPSYREDSQDPRKNLGHEGREPPFPSEAVTVQETADEEEGYPDGKGGIFENFNGWGALHVIPAVIFLLIIVVLALTFITESIPEFPGALASSILIVTLIIYGAATLLKA